MPVRVALGHDQSFSVNGSPLDGVRELDVDVTTRELDITGWDHAFASTLPTVADASITVTLYYPEEIAPFYTNLTTHPKQPMQLAVDGLFDGTFVVTGIRMGVPMGGVVPHEVTFKLFAY